MPIRMFFQNLRNGRQAQQNEILPEGTESKSTADSRSLSNNVNLGKFVSLSNSASRAKSQTINAGEDGTNSRNLAVNNALSNTLNIGGIPITDKLSGGRANNNGARSGNLQNDFSIGGLGLSTGFDSKRIGTGIGVNREPGDIDFHIGALNFEFKNNGGLLGARNTAANQAQSDAAATAAGKDSYTNAQTQTGSHNRNLGLLNVQSAYSKSQAEALSKDGPTSANAGGAGLQQNVNTNSEEQTLLEPQRRGFLPGLFGRRLKRSPQFFQNRRNPIQRLLFGGGPPQNQYYSEFGPGHGPSPQPQPQFGRHG